VPPTPDQEIAALESLMARAVADQDFEEAARLRDRLTELRAGPRRLPPGEMGLGTDRPRHVPPEGWVKPAKPDLMTRGNRPGGRRRR